MLSKFKLFREESGQAMVLFALIFVILCGFAAFVFDIGNVALEKQHLASAIDAACLAGAKDLPDTSKATATADQYIQLNGYQPSDISISFSNSNNTIDISGSKSVTYTLAKVLGFNNTTVHPSAAATIQSLGASFGYALFSGSKTSPLSFSGSNVYIGGSSHTNQNFVASGSNITITGACEAVNTITTPGSNTNIGNMVPNAAFVAMPDFSQTIMQQAQNAGQLYTGDKTYNGSVINVNQSIYVNGNISITGSSFKGTGCVLATGNITLSGSNLTQSTSDAVCFYSKTGNISVSGSNATLDGILYAPNGCVTIGGSNAIINGRVVSNTFLLSGSNLTIQSGTNELQSLPAGSVKLTQ